MEFAFEADQEHQSQAVDAVLQLLTGQPRITVDLTFAEGNILAAVANRLDLTPTDLVANLSAVQTENDITPDNSLELIEETIETVDGEVTASFPNFSVEMETGTGKTYVYTRTVLELYRQFGLRKFIVVVPSIAIREGVLKDLSMTRDHFMSLFGQLPYRFYSYDSDNLSQVRQFALSNGIELLVMTIDSFKKASNLIYNPTDWLQGDAPIHLIQTCRPVLILDEPQNMESELSVRGLAALHPLFALRYSATHRNPYNLVYRLTPFEAYRQALVKRIEVAGMLSESDQAQPFVRLDRVDVKKTTTSARVTIHKLMKSGVVKESTVTVRPGDSLADKSGRSQYEGLEIDEINPGSGFIRLASGVELAVGESVGFATEALFAAQIRYTIEEHLRRQERLRDHGIKVLTLFFIDRVDNYVGENPLIRNLFDEAFNDLKVDYPHWASSSADEVQAAYFAQKRRRTGHTDLLDSHTGRTKEDAEAFRLIMRHKERLLAFDEPVAFIFSHSALREGWDNPNVFQICTLNQSASEVKKRQEIGRGVRLCRNQEGQRVHDDQLNVLTVIANESYEAFVAALQSEIEEEYGTVGLAPKPPNARNRGTARLVKERALLPEFKELWERIRQKTRYSVHIDSESLVLDVIPALNAIDVPEPRISVKKAVFIVGEDDLFTAMQVSGAKTAASLAGKHPLPNLVAMMCELLANTSPPVRLTRSTLLNMFRRLEDKAPAMLNPHEFATAAVRVIKEKLADHLVSGIEYTPIDDRYEMSQLETEIEAWEQYLVETSRSVYDHVVADSNVERAFLEGLESRDDVLVYFKLPRWFTVPTPVGTYNPDWALVMQQRDGHGEPTGEPHLYLVRETKGANWKTSLRPTERRKVDSGKHHFDALGVDYRVVSKVSELP